MNDTTLCSRHCSSELPYPTRSRLRRSLLEGRASCFHDALCRHRIGVCGERSLHRRSFGVNHSYISKIFGSDTIGVRDTEGLCRTTCSNLFEAAGVDMLDFRNLGQQRIRRDDRLAENSRTTEIHSIEYVQCVVLCSEISSDVECVTYQRY